MCVCWGVFSISTALPSFCLPLFQGLGYSERRKLELRQNSRAALLTERGREDSLRLNVSAGCQLLWRGWKSKNLGRQDTNLCSCTWTSPLCNSATSTISLSLVEPHSSSSLLVQRMPTDHAHCGPSPKLWAWRGCLLRCW